MQLKRSGLALLMALFVLVGARELRADPILTQIVSSSEGVPNSVAGWDGGLSSYYATFSL